MALEKHFSTAEFIAEHKLDVNVQDPAATKLIAKKLKDAGYKRKKMRRHGTTEWLWSKGHDERLDELKEKLSKISL